MAKNIDPWQRKRIVYMIRSNNRLTTPQMANVAPCSERSITNLRKNLRLRSKVGFFCFYGLASKFQGSGEGYKRLFYVDTLT
jgi:hypothetical protein